MPLRERGQQGARLETRTKEFECTASQMVEARWRSESDAGDKSQPDPAACSGRWLRESSALETREMVIYGWAGRSQGKLWWKAYTVLTCKSIV
jgi:hypothetical protein